MRRLLVLCLLFAGLLVACDSPSPTGPTGATDGPGTVVIETPSPSTTTTSVPVSSTTTTTTTSTSTSSTPTTTIIPPTTTIPLATTRTYMSLGQVPPTVPSQLSLVLQGGPAVWTVIGFYRTPSGGGGQVRGQLVGNLDAGSFDGTLTAETPECVAQWAFSGSLDPQFLRWTAGPHSADCKGSPLSFNTLLMLATTGPPPTSTVLPTTTAVQCGYSLSANGIALPKAGGQATVGLATGPSCSWTVQNFVDWITVQPGAGTGSATIILTVAENRGIPRSATVIIGGQPFVVSQND